MGSKEKSQSLRLHLLRYTFTVAEVIRRSSPEPNQQPNPISLKMATQQQTQQATAESPYDKENDQQIVAQNPLSQQSNNHNTAPRADNTCCLLEQRDTDLLLFVSRGSRIGRISLLGIAV